MKNKRYFTKVQSGWNIEMGNWCIIECEELLYGLKKGGLIC